VQGGKGERRVRRTLHNVSAEEAERAMASFRERVNREPAQPPPLIAPTFEEFYDRYFPLIVEGLSPSTAKDYRLVVERCLLKRFGSWPLSDITAGAVNLWIRELKMERRAAGKRPLAGATINGYANILRAMVNYAVRFDVLEESPFKKRLEREKVNRPNNELSDRARHRRRRPPEDPPEVFTAIDDLLRPLHAHLTDCDQCYFLREYTSGRRNAHSETNRLIHNLKQRPDRRGTSELARDLLDRELLVAPLLRDNLDLARIQRVTLVPMPPSKARGDRLYDDRMLRVLRAMDVQGQLDIRELLYLAQSIEAAHTTADRPTVAQLVANLRIEETPSRATAADHRARGRRAHDGSSFHRGEDAAYDIASEHHHSRPHHCTTYVLIRQPSAHAQCLTEGSSPAWAGRGTF
jgi:Phage integrase, N-terminal SAM-like domain